MTGPTVPDRLRSTALAPLWQALHDRFSSGRPVTRVKLTGLTGEHRAALADLLGLDRYPGDSLTISVAKLDETLIPAMGLDTRAVTETILGPFGNRALDRAERQRERTALWEWLYTHPVVTAEPVLRAWADDVKSGGLVDRSVPRTRALLDDALTVLAALPADGSPLPVFAAGVLRRTHGLDDDQRLSGIVLRALAIRYGQDPPEGAQARRALWQRAGVACDALSTIVLATGLRPAGNDALSRSLRIWADAGHTSAITLAQLQQAAGLRTPPGVVSIVENPSILALAERRFGDRCPPLVCTSGWPNSAGILLLRRLNESGAQLRYHGDFDGDGLRIAAHVLTRCAAAPWRMSTHDYLEAADSATHSAHPSPGRITEAPWDPGLAETIRARGIAIHEEMVADRLLADLTGSDDVTANARPGPG